MSDVSGEERITVFAERLLERGILDAPTLKKALEHHRKVGGFFVDVLLRLGYAKESEVLPLLAPDGQSFVTAEKLSSHRISEKAIAGVPYELARKFHLVPIAWDETMQVLQIVSPGLFDDDADAEILRASHARRLHKYVSTPRAVESMIRKHYRRDPYAFAWLDEGAAQPKHDPTLRFEEGARADAKFLLREASRLRVSQEFHRRIHLERDPLELPHRILAVLFDLFPVDAGAVLLSRGESAHRSRRGRLDVPQDVLAQAASAGNGVLLHDFVPEGRTIPIASAMAVTLRGAEGLHGIIYLESQREKAFSPDELAQLQDAASYAVEALELCQEISALRKESAMRLSLSRVLAPPLVEKAVRGSLPIPYAGIRRTTTVLVAGISDVSRLATPERAPEEVFRELNVLFEEIASAIQEEGGAIDRMGTRGVLALFGLPAKHADDVAAALACALRIADRARAAKDRGSPLIGIGVHKGDVLFGALGPSHRCDLTALGPAVDVALRLGYAAEPAEILVTKPTAALADAKLRFGKRAFPRRNEEAPLDVVKLLGVRE